MSVPCACCRADGEGQGDLRITIKLSQMALAETAGAFLLTRLSNDVRLNMSNDIRHLKEEAESSCGHGIRVIVRTNRRSTKYKI